MNILVTGGAGYIGSHVAVQLIAAGDKVVVLDNLSTGHRSAVCEQATLVVGDVSNGALVAKLLKEHKIEAVLHFAALTQVDCSMRDPLTYYDVNTIRSHALFRACLLSGVSKFIFSSSAAVYGESTSEPVDEKSRTEPINPYGKSKLMTEWILDDLAAAGFCRHISLRYFNVAGASRDGKLGQISDTNHLIKVACEAACKVRSQVEIFGTDYPTKDGTGVRDFIHVEDLARAHVDALRYLAAGGKSQVLNCGYGKGYSVREILETIKRLSGHDFRVVEKPRRAGDPPQVVADSRKLKALVGWKPKLDDIELICQTALDWQKKLNTASRTSRAA